jgi:MFS family permease
MNQAYFVFIRENRRFLSFGFLMAWCSSYGQTYYVSVFSGDIRDEFGLSHGEFGLIYSLATLASGLSLIWLGRQIDRFDLRPFSTAICVGLVLASVLIGVAESVLMLGIALFALRLFGQGLMSHTAMTSMARYFDRDRGKAIGLANLGFPSGQAVFPIIGVALAATMGWRNSWFLMAGILAIALTPMLLYQLKGHGERHKDLIERTIAAATERTGARQWSAAEARRDPRFLLTLPAALALSFIGTGVVFHQVQLVEAKGWTLAWFASNFVVMAAASVMAALLAGPWIDRLGATKPLRWFLVPPTLSIAALASSDAALIVPVYMIGYGLGVGLSRVVLGALWAERYGVLHLGAIRALVTALMVLASALAPVLMGWMIDLGLAMDAILWMCVGYFVVAMAMVLAAGRLDRRPLA